jgi:hypothetical protein
LDRNTSTYKGLQHKVVKSYLLLSSTSSRAVTVPEALLVTQYKSYFVEGTRLESTKEACSDAFTIDARF